MHSCFTSPLSIGWWCLECMMACLIVGKSCLKCKAKQFMAER